MKKGTRSARSIAAVLLTTAAFLPAAAHAQQAAATADAPVVPEQAGRTSPQPVPTTPAAAVQQRDAGAPAQSEPEGLSDIIVTAERTSTSLQRTPVAVSAVSGSDLAEQRITDVQSLAATVPNFNFGTYGGTARLAIRGVGFDSINTGAEGRVAYYADGVYFSRPATAASGFFDIDRIEVLRGPQGTLYGRNATGGAFNVYTADPTSTLDGYFTQTIGNYGAFMEEGAISGPIADGIDARLAFKFNNRDGWGKNLLTGKDVDDVNTQSVRLKTKFEVAPGFDILVAGDYHREDDRNFASHYGGQAYPAVFPAAPSTLLPITDHGAPAPANIRDVASQQDPKNDREFWGGSVTATAELGGVTLKSITAYRNSDYTSRFNLSPGDAFFATLKEQSEQISQEFQLSGRSEKIHWVGGLYGFHESIDGSVDIPSSSSALQLLGIPAVPSPNGLVQGYWAGGKAKTDTVAGFGQLTYEVLTDLEVTAGARVAWERKKIDEGTQNNILAPYLQPNPIRTSPLPSVNPAAYYLPQRASVDETSFTPKLTVSYRFTPEITGYATVSKGYKSGGFDLGAASAPFSPETLWDYEAGIKGSFFDRRLRVSVAGFYYDYKNLQVSVVNGFIVQTQNAATARSYGLEGEAQALLTSRLKLTVSGGWLDAKFDRYVTADPSVPGAPVVDYGGNRLSQAPEFQGKAGLEYAVDLFTGKLTLRGDVEYVSRVYFTPFNIDTASQAANTKANAAIDFENGSGRWHAGVFVRNIGDITTRTAATVSSVATGAPLVTYLAPPRTYGATFGVRF